MEWSRHFVEPAGSASLADFPCWAMCQAFGPKHDAEGPVANGCPAKAVAKSRRSANHGEDGPGPHLPLERLAAPKGRASLAPRTPTKAKPPNRITKTSACWRRPETPWVLRKPPAGRTGRWQKHAGVRGLPERRCVKAGPSAAPAPPRPAVRRTWALDAIPGHTNCPTWAQWSRNSSSRGVASWGTGNLRSTREQGMPARRTHGTTLPA
mmetsp:Transcript_44564/g.90926  ORF Transcript_44564/g.90926 Transcript_44564/m.90926 type:complete len:209 (-) Transcript_44564:25-651(-)